MSNKHSHRDTMEQYWHKAVMLRGVFAGAPKKHETLSIIDLEEEHPYERRYAKNIVGVNSSGTEIKDLEKGHILPYTSPISFVGPAKDENGYKASVITNVKGIGNNICEDHIILLQDIAQLHSWIKVGDEIEFEGKVVKYNYGDGMENYGVVEVTIVNKTRQN